jgi:hypothetical protein
MQKIKEQIALKMHNGVENDNNESRTALIVAYN